MYDATLTMDHEAVTACERHGTAAADVAARKWVATGDVPKATTPEDRWYAMADKVVSDPQKVIELYQSMDTFCRESARNADDFHANRISGIELGSRQEAAAFKLRKNAAKEMARFDVARAESGYEG